MERKRNDDNDDDPRSDRATAPRQLRVSMRQRTALELMDRYGEWLDEGMERSGALGAWRVVYSVCGTIILITAILSAVFALLGWM